MYLMYRVNSYPIEMSHEVVVIYHPCKQISIVS